MQHIHVSSLESVAKSQFKDDCFTLKILQSLHIWEREPKIKIPFTNK